LVLPEEAPDVEATLWDSSKVLVLLGLGNGGTIDCRRVFCCLRCWWQMQWTMIEQAWLTMRIS
jgi:hypothetical protein